MSKVRHTECSKNALTLNGGSRNIISVYIFFLYRCPNTSCTPWRAFPFCPKSQPNWWAWAAFYLHLSIRIPSGIMQTCSSKFPGVTVGETIPTLIYAHTVLSSHDIPPYCNRVRFIHLSRIFHDTKHKFWITSSLILNTETPARL